MKVIFVDTETGKRLFVIGMPALPADGDHVVIAGVPKRSGRHGAEVWLVEERLWSMRDACVEAVVVRLRRHEPELADAPGTWAIPDDENVDF